MAVNEQKYTKNEALDILRCRDFKKLDTWNGFAYINAYPEAGSILIEIQEGINICKTIPGIEFLKISATKNI